MRSPLLLLLILIACTAAVAAESPFAFRDIDGKSLELTERGRPVLVYNYGMQLKPGAPEDRRRSSYLHPVYAPDGTVVTDDFPKDHYHHRGIFWAWPEVEWNGAKYDLWTLKGMHHEFVRWTERKPGDKTTRLGVENGWYVGAEKVIAEQALIETYPSTGRVRNIDFTLRFEAVAGPVTISGTASQNKGYGGFQVRFAPRDTTTIRTVAGPDVEDSDRVPYPWAELAGAFGGKRATLRITMDPKNAGFPNTWCLRHYGFLGVNFPGLDKYTLAPGKPLVMRYRVTISSE
jgi:hypothetical protein